MKERPILFSGAMIRAMLAGQKTQTRRVMNPQPPPFVQNTPDRHAQRHAEPYIDAYCGEKKTAQNPRGMGLIWCWWTRDNRQGAEVGRCPYGVPGDRLWVRETFRQADGSDCAHYAADPDEVSGGPWRPSIFMPRTLSRILLEVTEVRVQRVQEIGEEDARAEGVEPLEHTQAEVDAATSDSFDDRMVRALGPGSFSHRFTFEMLWQEINGKRAAWSSNPFVWVLTFKRVE